MKNSYRKSMLLFVALISASLTYNAIAAEEESFPVLVKRLQAEKPAFAKRQQDLLVLRYDLADRPANGTTMSRGKPVQTVCGLSCLRL